MKSGISRRQLIRLTAGSVLVPQTLRADTYPSRPGRLIVGFPAGTSSDIVSRLTAQWLSERLGQQFIVDNRPGAGTNLAADAVAHAEPDGYTLLWVTQTNAINATLYGNLNFDFIRDIAPVAGIMRVPAVMMENPSVTAKTLPEFIAYAKANPGKINMSSPGIGTINHVAGELFKMMAGVDMVHIPYRTSQFPDLLAGQVQVTFNPLPASLDFVRSGKLRALAVTSAERSAALPDVPAIAEFLPGYEATAWFGLGVQAATPVEIIAKLNAAMNAGLADLQFKGHLVDLGGSALTMSPGEFKSFIAAEVQKWAKVVKFSGAKPE
jgi:tripartite-type tricarboxylate transporter receptor subunit TctC